MPHSHQGRERLDWLYEVCESKPDRFRPGRSGITGMFRIDPKPRSFSAPTPEGPSRHLSGRQFSLLAGVILVLIAAIGVVSQRGSTQPAQANLVSTILPASDAMPIATGTGGNNSVDGELGGDSSSALAPAVAGAATTPTPASLAGQPPLRSHEVFGFAPYWTLAASSGFDLSGLTTVDYFGVDVNPDGSLDTSDAGAQGFQSQNFVDLVNRAHAAGDRVVVTVDDFSQSSLDQLALSTTAPQTLANSVLFLVKSRGLDGINLDLEGAGSGDQSGITSLVKTVSQTLKAVSPNSQVTMDTYASSAGDPNGFYDIPALSPFVDGFFVMAYQLNLRSTPSGQSPITSSMFSNQTTVNEYANAVPANKVILGLPFFGYDWPTTNGTMAAQPAGAPTVVTYAQEAASGHPIYWDPVTETAWTSYQVGSQWHEAFFENPNSLSVATQLARQNGIAGVGIWALGMDGPNDQAMVSALNGQALSTASMSTGPSTTSTSPAAPEVAPLVKSAAPRPQASTTTTTTAPTTTRTEPPAAPQPASVTYAGNFQGTQTRVLPSASPSGQRILEGTMTSFTTSDPNLQCLDSEPALDVYHYANDPLDDYVVASKAIGDCANASFIFQLPPAVPAPPATPPAAPYTYAGTWNGAQTPLLGTLAPSGQSSVLGTMTGFVTADPNLQCLAGEALIDVYQFAGDPTHDYVIARKTSGDCADAAFVFMAVAS